jgi:hypothetical protein
MLTIVNGQLIKLDDENLGEMVVNIVTAQFTKLIVLLFLFIFTIKRLPNRIQVTKSF